MAHFKFDVLKGLCLLSGTWNSEQLLRGCKGGLG